MLLFWICAALLTVAVILALARPLVAPARRSDAGERHAADVEVYRDQLGEIDTDMRRGLISDSEAAAARLEIARRLLASAAAADTPSAGPATPSALLRSSERVFA